MNLGCHDQEIKYLLHGKCWQESFIGLLYGFMTRWC